MFLGSGCPHSPSPIERALAHLERVQTKKDVQLARHIDFAGNWPQVFHFRNIPGYRIPDVSPFIVAFTHHALTNITPETAEALGITVRTVQRDWRKARDWLALELGT